MPSLRLFLAKRLPRTLTCAPNLSLLDVTVFEKMEPAQMRSYIEFLLRIYRLIDGFWYIYLTEKFGQEAADGVNEKVWAKVGGMAAKEIVTRFGITDRGLRGFVQALQYYPWTVLIGYEIEQH